MYSAEELCKKLLDGLSVDEAFASLPPYELRYIARIPVDVYRTAQRLGWRYFTEPRRGRPTWNHLRVNGASNDLEELMQWARSSPRWFLATGSHSGVFVLVVDGSVGQDSLIRLCSDDWTWLDTLRTQAGEQRFIFFQWPKGQRQISGSNCLGKGLYILGEGDWLRMPPSWELNGDTLRTAALLTGELLTMQNIPHLKGDNIVRRNFRRLMEISVDGNQTAFFKACDLPVQDHFGRNPPTLKTLASVATRLEI